jgi:tetratricopeptide (TPR) repeat protein
MIRAVRGHGLVKMGEAEAGTAELAEAITWFERSHLRYTGTVFRLRLGEGYLRQGERMRARATFEQALATSRQAGYRHLEGVALRCLGECLIGEDSHSAAEHLALAMKCLIAAGARHEIAKTLAAEAHLCKGAGDYMGAQRSFTRALALYEALGTLDEPLHVRAALAALADKPPR